MTAKKGIVDRPVLLITGGVCLAFVLWAALMPTQTAGVLGAINTFLCSEFGWLYLGAVTFFLVFLIWVACSRYGKIVLGKDDEKPKYTRRHWIALLFAAGMGIGIMFWSVAEPMSHYLSPLSAEARTPEAAVDAMRISFMHWGLHPWACFGIVGLPLAYFQFRKGKPGKVNSCLSPLLGDGKTEGFWGKTISVLVVFATVFGVATSLGLGAMQINSGLEYVFGIPNNTTVMSLLIIVITGTFILSATSGIDKGIGRLTSINMVLLAILLIAVFVLGPTTGIIDTFLNGIGTYIAQIIPQSLWTDPYDVANGWLNSWTVFYWAWWISWGPFVGLWLARVSRGRTIREFVMGAMIVPTVLCCLAIAILGGSAMIYDLNGVTSIAAALQQDTSYALFALLEVMPLGQVLSIVAIMLIAIFFVTSADSATYVCAMQSSDGRLNPPKSLMAFLGIVEALVAIVLLLAGGLSSLQMAVIIGAFPFMIVCFFIVVSFVKALRSERLPATAAPAIATSATAAPAPVAPATAASAPEAPSIEEDGT